MKTPLFTILYIVLFSVSSIIAEDYVHLSEIMYDTSLDENTTVSPCCNGEYIELYNAGSMPVDLSGWQLKGDEATEVYVFHTVTLPAASFLIVAYRHEFSPDFTLSDFFRISQFTKSK